MNLYQPTKADLLDMSLANFQQHAAELLGKWLEMTPDQKREFRAIGMSILTDESHERAA